MLHCTYTSFFHVLFQTLKLESCELLKGHLFHQSLLGRLLRRAPHLHQSGIIHSLLLCRRSCLSLDWRYQRKIHHWLKKVIFAISFRSPLFMVLTSDIVYSNISCLTLPNVSGFIITCNYYCSSNKSLILLVAVLFGMKT